MLRGPTKPAEVSGADSAQVGDEGVNKPDKHRNFDFEKTLKGAV